MSRNGLPTLRLIFDRQGTSTPKVESIIYFVATYQRVRRFISTGIRVAKGQWHKDGYIINHPNAPTLNQKLEKDKARLMKLMYDLCDHPAGFDLDLFVHEAKVERRNAKMTFLDFLHERVWQRKLSDATRRQHMVAINALEESGIIKYFTDLKPANLARWDAWLRNEKGVTHQPTLYGYHKRIRVYVQDALLFEYIRDNPYTRFKVERGKEHGIRYLNREEVARLEALVTQDKTLQRVRDLFIFQMYTGLSYSDMYALDLASLKKREDGYYYIRDQRLKTQQEYYLLLLPPAVRVLEKYGLRLPQYSNVKYNAYLKGLGVAIGLTKPLTSHMARHTFATTITLGNNVPIEVVAKMMGHADIATTQRYAKILAEDVTSEFKRLAQGFGEVATDKQE